MRPWFLRGAVPDLFFFFLVSAQPSHADGAFARRRITPPGRPAARSLLWFAVCTHCSRVVSHLAHPGQFQTHRFLGPIHRLAIQMDPTLFSTHGAYGGNPVAEFTGCLVKHTATVAYVPNMVLVHLCEYMYGSSASMFTCLRAQFCSLSRGTTQLCAWTSISKECDAMPTIPDACHLVCVPDTK